MAIFNEYKNIFDDFINSLDTKFLDKLEKTDKRLCNTSKSKGKPIYAKLKLKRNVLNNLLYKVYI